MALAAQVLIPVVSIKCNYCELTEGERQIKAGRRISRETKNQKTAFTHDGIELTMWRRLYSSYISWTPTCVWFELAQEKMWPHVNSWLEHNMYFRMVAKIIERSNFFCETLNYGQWPPSLLQIQYHVALEIPPAIRRALIFGQVCRKCTATPK